MNRKDRELDVVVWGATGFTGKLVAEHLLERHGAEGGLRWAIGGRNQAKLESVRKELGEGAAALPLIVGDSDDDAFVAELAERTAVVCTTVGPYAQYGSKLVAACAAKGTDYCDLTGEAQWIRRMIDAHEKEAAATGARIVHTCGFDSIPSDLGVHFLQREMRARHGVVAPRVSFRVAGFSGAASGGTIASMMNLMEEASRDPKVRRILANPYGLNPEGERHGPDGRDRTGPSFDEDFGQWIGPFVMAAINERVVRRSNALLGFPYGREFRYDEATLLGTGPVSAVKAAGLSAGVVGTMAAAAIGPLRGVLGRFLPAPGEGPNQKQREEGYFDVRLFGEHPSDAGKSLFARVTGDRDPGYGATSRMLGEAAVCLAEDELTSPGGIHTPTSAMAEPLLVRLEAHAGMAFTIEEPS